VGARPHRSRPARPSGTVIVWMGNASTRPRAWRVRTSSADTPSSAKVVLDMGVELLGGIGGADGVSEGGRTRDADPDDRPGRESTHTHLLEGVDIRRGSNTRARTGRTS